MIGFCKECKFWSSSNPTEYNSKGVCVRHPPGPVVEFNGGSIEIKWRQPETKTHDQCGEWESRYELTPHIDETATSQDRSEDYRP